MYGKMQEFLSQTLAEIKEAGLYKEERLIESAPPIDQGFPRDDEPPRIRYVVRPFYLWDTGYS